MEEHKIKNRKMLLLICNIVLMGSFLLVGILASSVSSGNTGSPFAGFLSIMPILMLASYVMIIVFSFMLSSHLGKSKGIAVGSIFLPPLSLMLVFAKGEFYPLEKIMGNYYIFKMSYPILRKTLKRIAGQYGLNYFTMPLKDGVTLYLVDYLGKDNDLEQNEDGSYSLSVGVREYLQNTYIYQTPSKGIFVAEMKVEQLPTNYSFIGPINVTKYAQQVGDNFNLTPVKP